MKTKVRGGLNDQNWAVIFCYSYVCMVEEDYGAFFNLGCLSFFWGSRV